MGKGKKKVVKKVVKEKAKQDFIPEPKKAEINGMSSLKKAVEQAKIKLESAQSEASELQKKAKEIISEAKKAYQEALAPYRDACQKAGVECEFSSGRLANVSERVTFLVEKVNNGIKVAIKGKPDTEEVLSAKDLKESINKAAYGYTEKHIGPREEIGNKGGGLSNRLRALMR